MIRPSMSTGTKDEMMAPTPPRANLHSQFIRVWIRLPSSLSKRPEMLEPNTRFLTSNERKRSGVKMMSSAISGPLRLVPDRQQQRRHEGARRAPAPAVAHEGDGGLGGAVAGLVGIHQNQRAGLYPPAGGRRFEGFGRRPDDPRRSNQALRQNGRFAEARPDTRGWRRSAR